MMWVKKGREITANHSRGVNMKGSDFVMGACAQTLFVLPFQPCK